MGELTKRAKEGPQPIDIWLGSVVSSAKSRIARSPAEISAADAKDQAILILLGKLAIHYWRPDFTEAQARQLYSDYVHDLRDYAFADINDAIVKYRRDQNAKFYPTVGQLVGIIRTIPSWDIRSPKEHGEILSRRAEKELAGVAAQITAGNVPKLIGRDDHLGTVRQS